jgi:hypothetical protein
MIAEHRTLEKFEDSLRHCINSYVDGDCDLETVMNAADKVACYKANVGISARRLEHNEREKAFYEQWLQENAPVAGVNSGHGILQDLFIDSGDVFGFKRKVIEEINNRDRMIVATVIQWLGSNCGMCFLGEALEKFGARIVYDKKS